MSETIFVVGAAGKCAGLVVPILVDRGARVRGLVRTAEQGDEIRRRGAAEAIIGDLHDPASFDAALKGVDSIFYIAPAFLPDEAAVGKRIVEAAKRADVRRFVFSSVIHPVLGLINHSAKAPVEEAVLNSGIEFTFLHPTLFFQNYAASWPSIVQTGVLAEPWSSDTRFSRVDYRDVAEVAAIALTEDRLLDGTFELCGDGRMNRRDVAALISDVLGRKIIASRTDSDAGRNLPQPIRLMFEHYEHHDLVGNALTLRAVLNREPRTLHNYFQELAVATLSDN
jgi:uncharacterized protein YbjT (DUF2867 family)